MSRHPGAEGRIPDFVGADAAAMRLRETKLWRDARAIKVNPDPAQRAVRQHALQDGKIVYMAFPGLGEGMPFFRLDPGTLDVSPRRAASVRGALAVGTQISLEEIELVDFVLVGSVAAAADGSRLGEGGGLEDLEYAIGREIGLIGPGTPVLTTLHPVQIISAGEIPMTRHDLTVDYLITSGLAVHLERTHPQPRGIRWEELSEEMIEAIPLLRQLRGKRGGEDGTG